jgi:hypothetical integral membrane protein (TIGR02206 family)
MQPFHPFGPSHFAALLTFAVIGAALLHLRRRQNPWAVTAEKTLAACLLLHWPATLVANTSLGVLNLENAFPFQYCHMASICAGITLWTRHQTCSEIAYFFGLAGTLQGLITPSLDADFPDPRYFLFFLWHGGVVVTALHLVFGLKFRPRPHSTKRMTLATFAYGLLALAINSVLGTNYGFVCGKPPVASMLDPLGPWPLYLAPLLGLACLFYWLLALPFRNARIKPLQDLPNHV